MLTFLQQLKRTQNLQASGGKKVDANFVLDNAASMSPIDIKHKAVSNFSILLHFFLRGAHNEQKGKKRALRIKAL